MLSKSLEEIVAMDNIEGPRALQDQITYILTGLAEVSVERAHALYDALGKAWKDNDEDWVEGYVCVMENEELAKIEDELYDEVCLRLEIPIENPNETLVEYLSEAFEDALEEVVMNNHTD